MRSGSETLRSSSLLRVRVGMLAGIFLEIEPPHHGPQQRGNAADDEGDAPVEPHDDPGDDGRRNRRAQPRGAVGDALDVAETMRRIPVAHRLRGSRESRPLAQANDEPCHEQAREPAGQPGQDGADADNDDGDEQRNARAIFSRAPAAEQHRCQIRPGEGAESQPHLGIGQVEMRFQRCCGRRDIDAIKIHDREQHAEHGGDDGVRAEQGSRARGRRHGADCLPHGSLRLNWMGSLACRETTAIREGRCAHVCGSRGARSSARNSPQ